MEENPFRTVQAATAQATAATPTSDFNTFVFQFPGNNSLLGCAGVVIGLGKK